MTIRPLQQLKPGKLAHTSRLVQVPGFRVLRLQARSMSLLAPTQTQRLRNLKKRAGQS